jgi:hypothetical protein
MPIASTAWLQDRQGRDPLSPHLEIRTAQFLEWPLCVPKKDLRFLGQGAKAEPIMPHC